MELGLGTNLKIIMVFDKFMALANNSFGMELTVRLHLLYCTAVFYFPPHVILRLRWIRPFTEQKYLYAGIRTQVLRAKLIEGSSNGLIIYRLP